MFVASVGFMFDKFSVPPNAVGCAGVLAAILCGGHFIRRIMLRGIDGRTPYPFLLLIWALLSNIMIMFLLPRVSFVSDTRHPLITFADIQMRVQADYVPETREQCIASMPREMIGHPNRRDGPEGHFYDWSEWQGV